MYGTTWEVEKKWWEKFLPRVRAVVAFGDWDAGDVYKHICNLDIPLVWLDSYCARDGVKTASKRLRSHAKGWNQQPYAWWQGVNDAESARYALAQTLRRET